MLIQVETIGSIRPVEPGRMRNSWYPRQKAEYMTEPTPEGLNPQKIVTERDATFGIKPKEERKEEPGPKKIPEREEVAQIQTRLLPVCVL